MHRLSARRYSFVRRQRLNSGTFVHLLAFGFANFTAVRGICLYDIGGCGFCLMVAVRRGLCRLRTRRSSFKTPMAGIDVFVSSHARFFGVGSLGLPSTFAPGFPSQEHRRANGGAPDARLTISPFC